MIDDLYRKHSKTYIDTRTRNFPRCANIAASFLPMAFDACGHLNTLESSYRSIEGSQAVSFLSGFLTAYLRGFLVFWPGLAWARRHDGWNVGYFGCYRESVCHCWNGG